MTNKNGTAPKYLTVSQVARNQGVHRQSVLNWINAGKLEAARTPGGHFRIKPEAVHKMSMRSNLVKHGHAVGELREAFLLWLEDNNTDLEVHGEPCSIDWVIGMLWNCTDILPSLAREDLADMGIDLSGKNTYAAAVQEIKAKNLTR